MFSVSPLRLFKSSATTRPVPKRRSSPTTASLRYFRSCLCSRPSSATPSMTTRSCRKDLINSALGNFPIIGPELNSHTHASPWKRWCSGHREHSPRLWRSWARACDPERDERGMEHPLRSLALDLPALPASAGGPRSARTLHDWCDGTHRVRHPGFPWLDSDGTPGGRLPGIEFLVSSCWRST